MSARTPIVGRMVRAAAELALVEAARVSAEGAVVGAPEAATAAGMDYYRARAAITARHLRQALEEFERVNAPSADSGTREVAEHA